MAVIAILNPKGGSGKTTLATNLAGEMGRRGLNTLLVDSDPQGSTIDWGYVREQQAVPTMNILSLTTLSSIKTVKNRRRGYDHVIIDGSARLEELSLAAIKVSSVVIIPVRPSALDLWAVRPVIQLIEQQQKQLLRAFGGIKQLRCAFCVTQQIEGSALAGEIEDAVAGFGMEILTNRMNYRVAYARAAQMGMTVHELDPEGGAAEETERLTMEILEFIHA
ncbi:MAG: AAA family ATPase [Bacteroidetes bacterium]|nr:AAA family ATPase [Bacteroidota bacterium]